MYRAGVIEPLINGREPIMPGWERYSRLSRVLSMQSSIWSHLRLVILAMRVQIRYNVSVAFSLALKDYESVFGHAPDLDYYRALFLDDSNSSVFREALLKFIDYHKSQQRGVRRATLLFFKILTLSLKVIWWPVLNGWRLAAWREFEGAKLAG